MKNTITVFIITLLGTLAFTNAIQAQQRIEEKVLAVNSNDRVQLNLRFGENIVVKGWDRNEVSFRAVVEINSGRLNDAFVAKYVEDGQGVRIETDFDKRLLEEGRASDCPEQYSTYSWNRDGNHQVICSEITFEVYVPRLSDLKLETIAADVELYDLSGPIDAKSISGYVDLSWPERNGADISMQTVSGEAYSNLNNLSFRNRNEELPLVGYELRGAIGRGGPRIRLKSVSGDLYLRNTEG